MAEKRQLQSVAFPDKSFYFLGGLTEATETITAFAAMCLWPEWFPQIAYGFAVLCGVTTEVCVHSTLREAVDRGYVCTTVGDATAASQPELQAPALAMIGVEGGLFGKVCSTCDVVEALQHAQVIA